MPNDPGSEGGVPDEVSAWLADLADERGLAERELMERLLAGDGADAPAGSTADLVELVERVDALEESVADLDDAIDEKVRDVRDRVVQVKRETDARAPRDHGHPDLEERLGRVREGLDALGRDFVDLDADVDRVDERVEAVDDRMSRGFSNYEDVLEYLIDATDDLNRKVETLARTVIDVRERTARLEAADARRAGADRLRETAGAHGVTEAKCEDCGETVLIGVLTAPECPHCEASFARLDPNRGFFRSSVLRTGHRPALEGEVEGTSPDLDAIVSDEAEAPPDVGVGSSEQAAADDPATGGAGDVEGGANADGGAATEGADGSGEGAGAATEDAEAATEDAEAATGDATSTDGRSGPPGAGGAADEAVDRVPGIGSAYAGRLHAAGVDTVGALALSEPGRLAGETEIAPGRVEKWVRQARDMVGSE